MTTKIRSHSSHPYLGHPSISKKNTQLNRCCFQYLWEKQNHPAKAFFFCNLRDLQENEGQKRPLGQKVRIWSNEKKIHYINFSKLEYVLLWPMVNFCLKVPQIWCLSSPIQGFEAAARWPRTLESGMTNIRFEVLLGRNWP